jgi:predicted negative regulator of RcsB-dependent stress response
MRLAAGQLTPAEAASALEKRLYAWRDDATELALRLRVADLQSQAGAPRPALSLLRETETLFPDAHDQVRTAEHQVLSNMLRTGAGRGLSPLDMVALVAENEDLLTDRDASNTVTPVLVDKLLALDLPDRAAPLLQRLMAASADGEAKAGLGARLADLRLDQADAPGAVAALDASAPSSLAVTVSTPLVARRTVLRARALAAAGESEAAVRLLAPETGAEALELRAQLCERSRDWACAAFALHALAQATVPPNGALTDAQQDLVLRLASAASQAGDMAVLQELRVGAGTRLPPGPRLELFHALTALPVQSLGDLPRSAHEAAAARALPAVLTSYPAH